MRGKSVGAFAAKVAAAGGAFLLNLVLAWKYGPEIAGYFFLAQGFVTLLCAVAVFGTDQAAVRFISSEAAQNQWDGVRLVAKKGVIVLAGPAVLGGALIFFSADSIANQLLRKAEAADYLKLFAFVVPLLCAVKYLAGLLRGLKLAAISVVLASGLVPALTCLLLILLPKFQDGAKVALVYLTGVGIAAACGWFWWKGAAGKRSGGGGSLRTSAFLASAWPLFHVAVINAFIQWFGTLTLGRWATAEDVGIFEAARRTAFLTSFVLIAVNSIAAPKFAELKALGQMHELEKVARQATLLMTLFAAPFCLFLVLAPEWIMGLFGPKYLAGAWYLRLLAIGQFVNVATGSVGFLLMMTGNEAEYRNTNLVALLLSLFLCLSLVPRYGGLGAAVAVMGTIATQNILAVIITKKKLGILTVPDWKACMEMIGRTKNLRAYKSNE